MAFDYFVVLAEMRTGSNLLQSYLNAAEGVTCHGELFNPAFIDTPGTHEIAGITLARRDADPWALLGAIRAGGKRHVGFRLFSDHDPRIWDHVLSDTACAKIVLTRNPLESHVSLGIAAATKQWKLGNVLNRKQARVHLDGAAFEAHVARLQQVQLDIQTRLQDSGQSAFYIGYDDLNRLSAINGLLRWLGVGDRLAELPRDLKKQNPEPILDKLDNPQDLAAALARIDRFDLTRTPNFEPRRGPHLDALWAAPGAGLVFMPLRGAPERSVIDWLAALDGITPAELERPFDEGRLQAWRRAHPGHRAFTVLRHPLKRAHAVYTRLLLPGHLGAAEEHMLRLFQAPLQADRSAMTLPEHREAFAAFLRFARASLSGQTGLAPWPSWASQSALLDGYAAVGGPDVILREDSIVRDLRWLTDSIDRPEAPPIATEAPGTPALSDLLDDEIQSLCRMAYARDYERFGFVDLG